MKEHKMAKTNYNYSRKQNTISTPKTVNLKQAIILKQPDHSLKNREE